MRACEFASFPSREVVGVRRVTLVVVVVVVGGGVFALRRARLKMDSNLVISSHGVPAV